MFIRRTIPLRGMHMQLSLHVFCSYGGVTAYAV